MINKFTADEVAHYLCAKSGWQFSNLQIQKLLYLSLIVYEHNKPKGAGSLFADEFYAWKYGPVIPHLYTKFKEFLHKEILFYAFRTALPEIESDASAILDYMVRFGGARTPRDLINITHRKGGAWEKVYAEGKRNVVIPRQDIFKEYEYWQSLSAADA